MAMLAHLGIVLTFVMPLVLRLTADADDTFLRHHSTEALNFEITFAIVWNAILIPSFFGAVAFGGPDGPGAWFVLVPLGAFGLFGAAVAVAIVAAVRASRGEWFRYPIAIRFVRGAVPRSEQPPRVAG
jgi:uncharacterized Tic20 family protein